MPRHEEKGPKEEDIVGKTFGNKFVVSVLGENAVVQCMMCRRENFISLRTLFDRRSKTGRCKTCTERTRIYLGPSSSNSKDDGYV